MGLFTKKTPEEKAKKKEANALFIGYAMQSIGKIPEKGLVTISLDPENKKLILKTDKATQITLPYERIRGFSVDDEVTLSKNGNAIGRAIVGNALFGGVGAIVGAASAKGNTELKWIGTLTYEDKDGCLQELGFIKFGLGKNSYYTGKDKAYTDSQFEGIIQKIISENGEDIEEL